MRRGDAFKGTYLKTEDLQGREHLLDIASVKIETIKGMDGDPDEDKAIIYFKKRDKGMVLNKTNWDVLEETYGEDSDDWKNCPMILYPTTTSFKGNRVACMRIKIPTGAQLKQPIAPPRDKVPDLPMHERFFSDGTEEPPPPDDSHAPPDEDIPF